MRARLCRYWTGWQQPWRWLVNTGQYTTHRLEIRPEAQLCLYPSLFIVLILSTVLLQQHHKHLYGSNITISPLYCCTCCTWGCRGSRWCWGGTWGPSRSRTLSHSTAGCCPSTPENCNIANIGAILAVFTFGCCLNICPSMSRSPALDSRLIILQTDTNTRHNTGVSGHLFYWWPLNWR